MITRVIEPRRRDVTGLAVGRVLPVAGQRSVGPFVFLDHMGPAELSPGEGIDVPPHPHIGLATVTYLFDGEMVHRDSMGVEQTIRPGDVNWMSAGAGVTHSERTSDSDRASASRLHGMQSWVALPRECEEDEPRFQHHRGSTLPEADDAGVRLRLLAGTGYGLESPVRVSSPLVYAELAMDPGAACSLPDEHEERAIFIESGTLRGSGNTLDAGRLYVLDAGELPRLEAVGATRAMVLGGAPLDAPRKMFWNFVSSTAERIERAKGEYAAGRFPRIPGDDAAFVPMP